ncbi:hypothetical protein BsWGS_06968 [Bradybaena similaris]
MKILSLSWMLTQLFLQIRGQNWNEYEGHCYLVLNAQTNFDASKNACRTYGSYMVEIEGEPELSYLQTLIEGSGDEFWVGLEFNNATHKFYWDRDGQEARDSMWLAGEPNYSGRCARLEAETQAGENGAGFLLGDLSCISPSKVICEKNALLLDEMQFGDLVETSLGHHCPMDTEVVISKNRCAHRCSRNKSCTAFQFNDSSQDCTTFRFDINCPTPPVLPLRIYERVGARC